MPLLPELTAALEEIERSGVLPAERYPDAPAARAAIARRRAARMITRAAIAAAEDHTVAGPGGGVPIRVYRPLGTHVPAPILVWLHGGGWTLDSLDGADGEVSRICQESGRVVISVDYRLAPEHKFPAALQDCLAVCRWAEDHAQDIGAGYGPLAVGGVSSGGNLAAAVALTALREGGPRLAQQLLIVPVLDLRFDSASWRCNGSGYLLTRQTCEWYRTNYLTEMSQIDDWRVSPLRAGSLTGLPPAFILTAEYDPLRDDGFRYAARLREAGVSVRHSDYTGVIHGFLGQFGALPPSERAFAEIGEVLRAHPV